MKIAIRCKEAKSIANHFRLQCTYFDGDRKIQDPELASAPFKYLLRCIQCGIAPSMKAYGERSCWGADFDEEIDEKTNVLLGKNIGLHR